MSELETLLPLTDSRRRMLEEATARYEACLLGPGAEALLARGIDLDTADRFRLGVVDDPLPEHAAMRGMLAIPYLGPDGRVLQLRFRRLSGDGPKYRSVSGEAGRLFNAGAVLADPFVVAITEGELDAVVLSQCGVPAVAVPGAQLWRPWYGRLFAGHVRVLMYADPDEAGGELLNRVLGSVRHAEPVRLKAGDVNETLLAEGPEALVGPYRKAVDEFKGNV